MRGWLVPCGMRALEALHITRASEPLPGLTPTDRRSIPNDAGCTGSAVHLDRGCYGRQETVARVQTLDRRPIRSTLLDLDGSDNRLAHDAEFQDGCMSVGVVGTSTRRYELGPIARRWWTLQRPSTQPAPRPLRRRRRP